MDWTVDWNTHCEHKDHIALCFSEGCLSIRLIHLLYGGSKDKHASSVSSERNSIIFQLYEPSIIIWCHLVHISVSPPQPSHLQELISKHTPSEVVDLATAEEEGEVFAHGASCLPCNQMHNFKRCQNSTTEENLLYSRQDRFQIHYITWYVVARFDKCSYRDSSVKSVIPLT